MAVNPRVLVIDRESDTAAVLQAVLEPLGAVVAHQRHDESAASQRSPEIAVIDVDQAYDDVRVDATAGRILIGSRRVPTGRWNDHFLEKPFHFPELVEAIEDLLALETRVARHMPR